MPARRVRDNDAPRSRRPPATTPEARENQLISAAVDLAEKQLQDGSASAQVITHYLKLGSSREKLEQERLALENNFLSAKTEQIARQEKMETLVSDALEAMRGYTGNPQARMDDDFED